MKSRFPFLIDVTDLHCAGARTLGIQVTTSCPVSHKDAHRHGEFFPWVSRCLSSWDRLADIDLLSEQMGAVCGALPSF